MSQTCAWDATACYICGNGVCEDAKGEGVVSCPADCGLNTIRAGFSFTCGLRNDTTVLCWGNNGDGQLGIGNEDDQPAATSVLLP